MNVFVDLHHGGLYKSLKMLFEDRLGWNLYRPIGLDWFNEGYWKIAEPYGNDPGCVAQYLDINNFGFSSFKNLNGDNYFKDGVYYIKDHAEDFEHKAITLKQFKMMQFDIVISSYQAHDYPYEDLVKRYQPKAKLISQIGNINQTTHLNNVMSSSLEFKPFGYQRCIYYHQEFDLNVFKYQPPQESKKISSFVNLLPEAETFWEYKNALPEFETKAYGIGCPDGTLGTPELIAEEMIKSQFGWHIKPGGDGFGHVIHNWFACGRPIITKKAYYAEKMADPLMQDRVTCIDLDRHTKQENLDLIRKFSQGEEYIKMCQNVYHRFREVVNYDNEFKQIKTFLENLA
jgi:hypothetical protein